MIAITTSSSTSVNPRRLDRKFIVCLLEKSGLADNAAVGLLNAASLNARVPMEIRLTVKEAALAESERAAICVKSEGCYHARATNGKAVATANGARGSAVCGDASTSVRTVSQQTGKSATAHHQP